MFNDKNLVTKWWTTEQLKTFCIFSIYSILKLIFLYIKEQLREKEKNESEIFAHFFSSQKRAVTLNFNNANMVIFQSLAADVWAREILLLCCIFALDNKNVICMKPFCASNLLNRYICIVSVIYTHKPAFWDSLVCHYYSMYQ